MLWRYMLEIEKLYRVIALVLVNIFPLWDIEGASLRASVDIPSRENIHQYQCNNPFII